MTNIITAVMIVVLSMPRTMFLSRRTDGLCRSTTFANGDIMASQWKNYKQSDHCSHHGLSCLPRSEIFVKQSQKVEAFFRIL